MGRAKCSAGCKEEFKRSNFLLIHDKPHLFVTSQWSNCGCSSIFYLVWRAMVAILFIAALILSGLTFRGDGGGPEWFIYLTNWSLFFLGVDIILQFALSAFGFYLYRKEKSWGRTFSGRGMPWYLKMEWVLTNVASVAGLLVTILYWSVLYTPDLEISAENLLVHAINSVYIVINVFITAAPVRIYHVFHAWVYAAVYVIFSVIYSFASGGNYVYSVLDWAGDPSTAVLYALLASIPGALVVWLVYYGLYRLRLVIFQAMDDRSRSSQSDPEEKSHDLQKTKKVVGEEELGRENPGFVNSSEF